MSDHNLNNALAIPSAKVQQINQNKTSDANQLNYYSEQMGHKQQQLNKEIVVDMSSLQRSQQHENGQISSHSASIITHARQAAQGIQTLHHNINCSDDAPSFSKVIDVCNEIDKAEDCVATEQLIRKCIKEEVWTTNKFLSNLSIQTMKIDNRRNPNTVLNILLNYTRKNDLTNLERYKFWKKYSGLVQHDLNNIKTICTRNIKEEMMLGK